MRTAHSLFLAFVAAFLLAAAPLVAQPEQDAGASARVQPGDQVALRIEREPQMSGTFLVDERGEVVLPRLGSVRVADQTAGALQSMLREQFARFLREPVIEVKLLRRVAVGGDVYKPGIYYVDLTATVRDVVAMAGGVTELGSPDKIEILRDGTRFRLPGRDVAAVSTAELRSGDRIVVGRRSWLARNPNAAIGTFSGLVGLFIGVVQLLKS